MEIITMRNHSLLTRLNVTLRIFPCRHHFQADNKQPYSHVVKLPDGRFGVIRFFAYSTVSGSVPRTRNKQSGNICPCATGHGEGDKHNI
jgi:hypothetical protein